LDKLEITRSISIRPTVEDLATVWCEMNSYQQAHFFDLVATEIASWGATREVLQLSWVAMKVTPEGSRLMRLIGEANDAAAH